VIAFPGERFGVAVFSNLASFPPGTLTRQIADIYLASKLKQPVTPAPGAKPAAKEITLPAKSLAEFTGTYWFESTGLLRRIVLEKGKLFYVRSAEDRSELAALPPTEFRMKDVPDEVRVVFSDRKGDRFDTLTVTVNSQPPVVGKRMELFSPSEADLKEYAGRYYSEELDTCYDLFVKSGALLVRSARGEPAPADPQKKDVFSVGGYARFRFQRDANGVITGFTVTTGRVLNLKFVRMK